MTTVYWQKSYCTKLWSSKLLGTSLVRLLPLHLNTTGSSYTHTLLFSVLYLSLVHLSRLVPDFPTGLNIFRHDHLVRFSYRLKKKKQNQKNPTFMATVMWLWQLPGRMESWNLVRSQQICITDFLYLVSLMNIIRQTKRYVYLVNLLQ